MFSRFGIMLVAALILPFIPGASTANRAVADRVEEDWELVVNTPNAALVSPQLSMEMMLDEAETSPIMEFDLNYRNTSGFLPGGLAVKIRSGNQINVSSTSRTERLSTANETITWTQRVSLNGGDVHFKVLSGNSTTWGDFGGDSLEIHSSTSLTSLPDYDPAQSVAHSTVSFGANRVTKLTLVKVRYYQGATLLNTDSTARAVKLTQ